MISLILKPIVWTLKQPFLWAIIFLITFFVTIFFQDRLFDMNQTSEFSISKALEDWKEEDPEVARIQAKVENDKALAIAHQSAMADKCKRSTEHAMVEEWRETGKAPYRVRLAALALDDPNLSSIPERAEEFFIAHGTTCEFLELATDVSSAHDYLVLLEQAKQDPAVWSLVWDDPVALQIWSDSDGIEEVKFYRANRDWLADALVALDYTDSSISGLSEVVRRINNISNTAEVTLSSENANLGVVGLMALVTHGNLIDRCRKVYGLDPEEIVSILYMNPDVFNGVEGDRAWVINKAGWLNNIEKNSPSVWLSAMEYPFTLKLHKDAPHVSEELLAKHGSSMPQILLYDLFQNQDGTYNREVIVRAAEAMNAFGDLAIHTFVRYDDPIWKQRIERFLLDDDIGVRLIPFIARFQDEAFDRIEDDKAWLDKYFKKDGTPIEEDWYVYIPGGALYKVAENWTKGLPNEGSELGWAAFDAADIALTVATFGASKAVTTAGKSAQAIDKAADLARAGSKAKNTGRAENIAKWSKRVATRVKGSENIRALLKLVRSNRAGSVLIEVSWLGLRTAMDTTEALVRSTRGALGKWRSVNPATKKWVYRGALGACLFIQIKERTLPNADKIGSGIGKTVGNWAAGMTKGAGLALADAFSEFMFQTTNIGPTLLYYISLAVFAVLALIFIYLGFRQINRRQIIVAKS